MADAGENDEKLVAVGLERSESGKNPNKPKPTFKLVANVVMAMRRFQHALNPQLNVGKRAASPSLTGMPNGRLTMQRTGSGRAGSGKTLSGRPDAAGKQHGFKGNLLFKPLPPLPGEQESTA